MTNFLVVTKWEKIQNFQQPQPKTQVISNNQENNLEKKTVELVKNAENEDKQR